MDRRTWMLMAGAGWQQAQLLGQERGTRSASAEARKRAAARYFPDDPHRPRYHFLPPKNWMNDPNGLIFHDGKFHMFYQHNPGAAVWGDMHWGHAMSEDLITWMHLPMALAPTPGGYDKDGVFSGCMVVDGDTPTIVYTGTQPEVQAIATSNHPQLETWTKYEGNPVIPAPPAGMETTGFRDPFVWREGDDCLMVVGSGVKRKGGSILLYRSPDLRKWEYLHPLVESSDLALGKMWECPNFFPLGDKHVLLISPQPLKKALYAVGTYADRRFTIERTGSLDDGGHFYAPQVFLDGSNRRVMFGWSWEGRSRDAQVKAGWAGAMTLPRVLTLDADGALHMEPHPYCRRLLHRFQRAIRVAPLGADLQAEIDKVGVSGEAGRLDLTILPGDASQVVLSFYAHADGKEETRLVWNREPGELVLDRSKTSLDASQDKTEFRAPFPLLKNAPLQLTLYFDRSLVEIYAIGDKGTTCMTTRVYPSRKESTKLRITASAKNPSKEVKKAMVKDLVWRPIKAMVS